jgi:plasmid maintenance system antidote protein VapI
MTAPADETRAGLASSAAYGAGRGDAPADRPADRPAPPVAPARELTPHEVLVRHALEVSRLTVTRMAEELGIPRATLEAYRLGTRRMPAAARMRLSAYLARHSEMLRLISQALATPE